MGAVRIGILGTSEIAFRRFLPALKKMRSCSYEGVASRDVSKTEMFVDTFGGRGFRGYQSIVHNPDIDAVYIPLPPALHYEWAKEALLAGKHVLLEKPAATCMEETLDLIQLAQKRGLAIYENYMFQHHRQLNEIQRLLADGVIGKLRLIRTAFGFPKRKQTDFRYDLSLGGGALLDCGGYTVKLASLLLGPETTIVSAILNKETYDVDLYGCATLKNKEGLAAQISFGMDNAYKCELEIWGSLGILQAPRIFTAPPDDTPKVLLQTAAGSESIIIPRDCHFTHSIEAFLRAIQNEEERTQQYSNLTQQAELVEDIRVLAHGRGS